MEYETLISQIELTVTKYAERCILCTSKKEQEKPLGQDLANERKNSTTIWQSYVFFFFP